MKSKKPLLADGSVVGDYEPLMKYFEIAKSVKPDVAEKSYPRSEDFNYVKNYVNTRGKSSLLSLLEDLTVTIIERVDSQIAVEAFKKAYGVELEPEDARRRIAKLIAGWIIEASKNLGYITY